MSKGRMLVSSLVAFVPSIAFAALRYVSDVTYVRSLLQLRQLRQMGCFGGPTLRPLRRMRCVGCKPHFNVYQSAVGQF